MKNQNVQKTLELLTKSLLILLLVSSCTKSREAALPDEESNSIFAINEFGDTSTNSSFSAVADLSAKSDTSSMKALELTSTHKLSSDDVNVPDRLKFMFDSLPLSSLTAKNFKITFTVDKNNVTAYKIANNVQELTALEKGLAITEKEAKLLTKAARSSSVEIKAIALEQKQAKTEKDLIISGQQNGSLLVPMFKYSITGYGILERKKNELKESTSTLGLKDTDFKNATHIQISSKSDARLDVGLKASEQKELNQLFLESKIDNKLTTAGNLSQNLKIGLKFLEADTQVLTKLDTDKLLVYQVSTVAKLNENQLRLLNNNAASERIKKCSDADVSAFIQSQDQNCVIILAASLPVTYKKPELTLAGINGETSSDISFTEVPRSKGMGLVEVLENTPATQEEVTSGLLDPNSTLKISDLSGEFFFRRTFESAASSFLGRTGTSGDMAIVKFELEDDRIVVRNQKSLVQYTGQGAQDREEILSIPVTYHRLITQDSNGVKLTLPKLEETTKEKAQFAKVDWLKNSIPDSTSPLAFFDAGKCFIANSSQKVTNTDMRLSQDGVLNFSINSSYTVDPGCAAIKDVNSAYWAGMAQYNYNVQERISFVKHTNLTTDQQFALNISPMAQEAFNFGVFTLADKVTDNGTIDNRDGSEKYLPMVHDFRNGRVEKWYLGGINDPKATDPERRTLLVEAAQQVIAEWNASFRMSFKGTPLQRDGDYIQLVVEEPGEETGRLGDLDKNYIWFNEIPADNGLLGVAQPAANPRSGIIESANVIIYTGNTFQQTENLIKSTKLSRSYEKMIESIQADAIAKAKETNEVVSTEEQTTNSNADKDLDKTPASTQQLVGQISRQSENLKKLVKNLNLDQKRIQKILKQINIAKSPAAQKYVLNEDTFKSSAKGQKIELATNSTTLSKKITDLAMNKSLSQNPRELEFRINDLMIAHGELTEQTKQALNKRQNILALMLKFDRSTLNRPGCFMYEREQIEDAALNADPDPRKNLMINFKLAVKSTLSHELGHAFGLLHNFTGSTDKAKYEFDGENTGRNYSSIMDYISDIDQHYAGPGPYDVQAIRASYTGYVPANTQILSGSEFTVSMNDNKIKLINNSLIHINDVLKLMGENSFVHFTKDTVNKLGILDYFAQCSDGGVGQSALCARFDTGGSALEIVKNKIADYRRTYANGNYVYDRILFGWPQKMKIIQRNIMNFQEIRSFLDETLLAAIHGIGRPKAETDARMNDLVNATIEGYKFFHEVIRIPDSDYGVMNVENRFFAVPYEYQDMKLSESGEPVIGSDGQPVFETKKDVKILEARSLYDQSLSRDKLETIGIGYDKIFAMNFLMQASPATGTDDSQMNMISFVDFEKFFLGVKEPSESLTINTIIDILTNNLTAGFFTPSVELISSGISVDTNRMLGDETVVASVVGLAQAKWNAFDPFAESFKVGRATVKNAPKDRVNATKLGQNNKLSDAIVYYAAQGGLAADIIVKQAARSELILGGAKEELYPQLKLLLDLDKKFNSPILNLIDDACATDITGKLINNDACVAAYTKSDEDYIKEMPVLAGFKKKADDQAKRVVAVLRKLNAKEILMAKSLDVPNSKVNFEQQVEIARQQILAQTRLIEKTLNTLSQTPMSALSLVMKKVYPQLKKIKASNDQLSNIPTMAIAQGFILETAQGNEIVLMDKSSKINGSILTKYMIDSSKLINSQEKIADVLDRLSVYTRFVDPDLTQTK